MNQLTQNQVISQKPQMTQNQTITEQLANVHHAVVCLQAMGLTVYTILVGERQPLIHIEHCRNCVMLESAYTTRTVQDGVHISQRVAFLSNCKVCWEVRS